MPKMGINFCDSNKPKNIQIGQELAEIQAKHNSKLAVIISQPSLVQFECIGAV
jgi:hypothetical protein